MKQFNDEWSDSLSEFKMLSFKEVSAGFEGNKNLLQGIQKPNPENTEYKDDEYINLTDLLDRIRLSYRNGSEMQYVFSEYFNDTPQMYIMDNNKNHIDISARIALKNGTIKVSQNLGSEPFMEVFFDDKKRLTYTLSFRYSGSRQVAIMLRTYSFKEYRNLLLYLGYGDVETDYDASKFFIKEFTDFLKDTQNTADDLYKVYADLPKSFVVHIHLSTEKVVDHLKILTDVDDTGWFSWTKDTSSLLITLMAMFRDYDKVVDYFNENPKFVNEIYDNLDGYSDFLGKPVSNRIHFASILSKFIQQDQEAKTKITNSLTNYGNYYIESNILELNDTLNTIKGIVSFDWDFDYKDAIFLQQKRKVAKTRERPLIGQDGEPINDITADETIVVDEDIDPGYFYNPMSPVTYLDKEGNSHLVTALFIKAIADEKEWAEVMHHIRIGGDILAIIAGFMTMGLTAEFSVLAVADIGLAGVDLALMSEWLQKWLSQYPEGRWFVENWDLIYAFVGAGIMSVVVMEGILIYGPALLENLKNIKNAPSNYRSFITQLDELVKEVYKYESKLIRQGNIEEVIIAAKQNSSGLIKKVLKTIFSESTEVFLRGAAENLVEKGFSIIKKGEDYIVSYKGVEILKGKDRLAGEFLRSAHFSTRQGFRNFIAVYVNKVVAHGFLHNATSGAKLLGNEDLGTFLVGSFGSDLQNILKELDYPELIDKAMLKSGYPFNAPKGQKFNLLNVSDEIYTEAIAKGGFFTNVNSKWVDAAVRQKVEVVIMSNEKYLRNWEKLADGTRKSTLSGFGKEIHRFEWKHGYRLDVKTKRMLSPEQLKGKKFPTLTQFNEYTIK
ncbi:hypothetical protein BA768_04870 [Chryseobacterium sp. CBo1]|uniref:hypothetical protein n=1 Tax=Chryseobacterium sp. CBo1 TaxID=1869230 RepID=UPI0008105613|nr:hypothetical protein [Chryseobacterium sp. CBo1]OCK50488.1 hypothetical protein BA768_04870 [Chryseobacterium sp. CBo1]